MKRRLVNTIWQVLILLRDNDRNVSAKQKQSGIQREI